MDSGVLSFVERLSEVQGMRSQNRPLQRVYYCVPITESPLSEV